MAAYRASRHETTGFSPNFLMLGRENSAPIDIVYGLPESEREHSASIDEFVTRKLDVMRRAYTLVRENTGISAERNKRNYDLKVKPNEYAVGDWVFYYSPRKYVGKSPKWQRMFSGPYLVTQVLGPVNVRIQLTRRSQPMVAHIDKLKRCLGVTPTNWLIGAVHPEEVSTGSRDDEVITDELDAGESLFGLETPAEAPKQGTRVLNPGATPFVPATNPPESVETTPRPRRETRRPAWLRDYA